MELKMLVDELVSMEVSAKDLFTRVKIRKVRGFDPIVRTIVTDKDGSIILSNRPSEEEMDEIRRRSSLDMDAIYEANECQTA